MQLAKALSFTMFSIILAFAENYSYSDPSIYTDDTARLGTCILLMSSNGCDCGLSEEKTTLTSFTSAILNNRDQCFSMEDFLDSTALLTDAEKLAFKNWMEKAKKEIIDNPALTKEQVLSNLYHSLNDFLALNPRIKSALKFTYNKEWNYAYNLHNMVYDINSNMEKNPELKNSIVPNSNGSYPIIDALNEFGQNGSPGQQIAIKSLIFQTKDIINKGDPQWLTLAKIYQLFQDKLGQDFRIQQLVTKNCNQKYTNYKLVCSFFDTCPTYYHINNFFDALNGSLSKCIILTTTIEKHDNKTHTVVPPSIIDEIINHTLTGCFNNKDAENHIKTLCAKVIDLYNKNNWQDNYTITNDLNDRNTIKKVREAYLYCTNPTFTDTNCHKSTSTSPIQPTTPSSDHKTTASASTNKPSVTSITKKPNPNTSTTTPGYNKCDIILSFTKYNQSSDSTILLDAIKKDQENWTPEQVKSFQGYKKRIYNITVDKHYTEIEKFKLIRQVLVNFSVASSALHKTVYKGKINDWGTVAEYVACPVPKP